MMENETYETIPETAPEFTEDVPTSTEAVETVPAVTEEYVEYVPQTTQDYVYLTEPPAETLEGVTVENLSDMTNTLVHVNLFGSFLICGAIMATALMRRMGI